LCFFNTSVLSHQQLAVLLLFQGPFFQMFGFLVSFFVGNRRGVAEDSDPREPACLNMPRTPQNEWKKRSECDVLDPRSPTLGIHRSPVAMARKWSHALQEATAEPLQVTKEKDDAVTAESSVPAVTMELEKLRLEFSTKQRRDTPTKMFLSSPALWKGVASSPQCSDSPVTVSDPLLGAWHMPSARRNLFSRSDSASAA